LHGQLLAYFDDVRIGERFYTQARKITDFEEILGLSRCHHQQQGKTKEEPLERCLYHEKYIEP
jgi:hypothetical protein